jgi:hypothetical protein
MDIINAIVRHGIIDVPDAEADVVGVELKHPVNKANIFTEHTIVDTHLPAILKACRKKAKSKRRYGIRRFFGIAIDEQNLFQFSIYDLRLNF